MGPGRTRRYSTEILEKCKNFFEDMWFFHHPRGRAGVSSTDNVDLINGIIADYQCVCAWLDQAVGAV
jgi:hypothetical protein